MDEKARTPIEKEWINKIENLRHSVLVGLAKQSPSLKYMKTQINKFKTTPSDSNNIDDVITNYNKFITLASDPEMRSIFNGYRYE